MHSNSKVFSEQGENHAQINRSKKRVLVVSKTGCQHDLTFKYVLPKVIVTKDRLAINRERLVGM